MSGHSNARPNPQSEWIVQEVPALRIIDETLWRQTKLRQKEIARDFQQAETGTNRLNHTHRRQFLLSGLLVCGICEGPYVRVRAPGSQITIEKKSVPAVEVPSHTARKGPFCGRGRAAFRSPMTQAIFRVSRSVERSALTSYNGASRSVRSNVCYGHLRTSQIAAIPSA